MIVDMMILGTRIRWCPWKWGVELGIIYTTTATHCKTNHVSGRVESGWVYQVPSSSFVEQKILWLYKPKFDRGCWKLSWFYQLSHDTSECSHEGYSSTRSCTLPYLNECVGISGLNLFTKSLKVIYYLDRM